MHPVLFQVRGITVYSFGLMVSLGAVAALGIATVELRRRGVLSLAIPVLLCAVAAAALAGAYGMAALLGQTSDLSAVGAILAGGAAAMFVARMQSLPPLMLLDVLAPPAALGEAFARFGCHLAGDGHWGPPTELPWGVHYRAAVVGWDPSWPPVHPTPLYESAAALSIFLVLRRNGTRPSGWAISLYLLLAGSVRFLAGFLRPDVTRAFGLEGSQLVAALAMVLGVLGLACVCRRSVITHLVDPTGGP